MYEKFFENSRRVVAGIPEHLLKRAQAARDALAGKAPSAETGESASNLPAKTSETKPAPAAPVASAPPPPPPDPSYVIESFGSFSGQRLEKKFRFGRWQL